MTLHLVKLAINNIRSRRTRSWLTILGVLIGVTAVVSLLSIGTGIEEAVLQEFKDIGYDIIVITPGGMARAFAAGASGGPQFVTEGEGPPGMMGATTAASSTRTFSPGQVGESTGNAADASTGSTAGRTFSPGRIGASSSTATDASQQSLRGETPVDTDALLKAVSGLLEAGNLGTRIVSVDAPAASGFLRLTTPSLSFLASFPSILGGFTIGQGTSFTNTTENEAVIGARSAESLGVEVGDTVTIDGTEFAVVGILVSSKALASEAAETSARRNGTSNAISRTVSGSGASFLTRGMTNTDDSLFVLQERATSVWSAAATNTTTIVRMATGVDVDAVMTGISTELTAQGARGTPVSVQQIAGSIQGTLGMIETVLASIAAVALIVGGVGLMNTMYTSVLERTREIGILKAVGARDSQVMALFLVDSGLMGLIGGILGLLVGSVLSVFGTRLLGPALGVGSFQPVFGASLIVGVLVASFVIGALSGAWPAWRASRLNPVEALASE
jgi:putative ABC transport system permease protein